MKDEVLREGLECGFTMAQLGWIHEYCAGSFKEIETKKENQARQFNSTSTTPPQET